MNYPDNKIRAATLAEAKYKTDAEKQAFIEGFLEMARLISEEMINKKGFYTELAEKLRLLWPPGQKDGKWAWRDSVSNLAIRLETLWKVRNLKDYSIDECLMAARRYLANYDESTKYMQVLKYFILKQDSVVLPNGKLKMINKSAFADALESNVMYDMTVDVDSIFESSDTIQQGRLI